MRMLAMIASGTSKLAYVGGFNEASSFNRCFRRRFGAIAGGDGSERSCGWPVLAFRRNLDAASPYSFGKSIVHRTDDGHMLRLTVSTRNGRVLRAFADAARESPSSGRRRGGPSCGSSWSRTILISTASSRPR
jgi:AraC-like DNA-binding protein